MRKVQRCEIAKYFEGPRVVRFSRTNWISKASEIDPFSVYPNAGLPSIFWRVVSNTPAPTVFRPAIGTILTMGTATKIVSAIVQSVVIYMIATLIGGQVQNKSMKEGSRLGAAPDVPTAERVSGFQYMPVKLRDALKISVIDQGKLIFREMNLLHLDTTCK